MSLKKLYGTDKKKESEGVWIPLFEDMEVKVARIGNPEYQKAIKELSKPHRAAISKNRDIPEKAATEILVKAMVRGIVKGWRGFTDENGDEIPFTPENVYAILMEYPDLRNDISAAAEEMSNFKHDEDEDAAKNSESSSSGN